MGLVILALIWYNLWGKNDPKVYHWVNGMDHKKLVRIGIIAAILLSCCGGEAIFEILVALAVCIAPFLIIGKVVQSSSETKKRHNNSDFQKIYREERHDFSLPKAVKKRYKILQKFNQQYDLNLNDEQMNRIVEASYVDYYWEKELYDMTKTYSLPVEWYQGDTGWLRIYLKAFPSMNISSDFSTQYRYVEAAFRKILDETDMKKFYGMEDCIEDVNRRYNLWFDEQTFTMMLRFMEKKGYPVKYPSVLEFQYESEVDRLAHKYDENARREKTSDNSSNGYGQKADNNPFERRGY